MTLQLSSTGLLHFWGQCFRFSAAGTVVETYLERLAGYGTVLTGCKTNEFIYRCGLLPCADRYLHARGTVVSDIINLRDDAQIETADRIDKVGLTISAGRWTGRFSSMAAARWRRPHWNSVEWTFWV